MSLWFTDENDNSILLYAGSDKVKESFKKQHGFTDYHVYGFPSLILCNENFKRVKELQKKEFYRQKERCNMPADAKHMFGGADVILKEQARRKNKKRSGLLMPGKKNERRVSINNGIKTEPTEFAKGGSIVDVISQTHKLINEMEVDTQTTINKREIENLLKNIQEELEVLYADMNDTNETVTIHKEGQAYAYKLLLRRLTNK